MKRIAFTAIFAITAMALSSFLTPCRAQVIESQLEGITVDEDPVCICEEVDEEMIFTTYETQPKFPGGMQALMEYMKNELRYPKKCRKAKIEGRSFVRFTVEKDGKLTEFEIIRSSGNKLLDKEAIRAIRKMPRWIPATQCNTPVPMKYVLPVRFRLDEYNNTKHNEKEALPVAEQMPEFPGGMPALLEYLKTEIRYPKKCREAGVEGWAIITFVVKKNGKAKSFEVARSSGNKLLDKEAMRVIKKMPKWTPGMHEGKNVNVMFALPISFKLR